MRMEGLERDGMAGKGPARVTAGIGEGLLRQSLRHYLAWTRRHSDPHAAEILALHTASRRALDVLALRATGGRMVLEELAGALGHGNRKADSSPGRLRAGDVSVGDFLALARASARTSRERRDLERALALFEWARRARGLADFDARSLGIYQSLAYDLGEYRLAHRLFEAYKAVGTGLQVRIRSCDLLNPRRQTPFSDATTWEQRLFGLLGNRLAGLKLAGSTVQAAAPFDRLHAEAPHAINDGPLVSVIAECRQAGPSLRTGVGSLLAQSWRNLEILLVDADATGASAPALRELAAMDPRIRLVEVPGGAAEVHARNAALTLASGEFVTSHDPESWSHPQRIEMQVASLLERPDLVGVTGKALHCDVNLVFNRIGPIGPQEDPCSTVFRRGPVLERIGFYDSVRDGAEVEYLQRMLRAFGDKAHCHMDMPVVIKRRDGVVDPVGDAVAWRNDEAMRAYRRNFEYWHGLAASGGGLRLEERPDAPRSFPAPGSILGNATPVGRFDVVFMDDLCPRGDKTRLASLRDEIHACLSLGLKVGIVHVRSFRALALRKVQPLWQPFQAMIHKGEVHEVVPGEESEADVVVVRSPEVLMFADGLECALRARRVVIVADEPMQDARGRTWYCPEACERTAARLIQGPVEWAARRTVVEALKEQVGRLASRPYPVVVEPAHWRVPMRNFNGRRPVIGRVLENLPGEVPRPSTRLLQAYPATDEVAVCFLGSTARLKSALANHPWPGNWSQLPAEWGNYATLLASCDFYVHFDSGRGPIPERIVAQALASGCVVITSKELATGFGNAVIGADEVEVLGVIRRLANDPEAFRRQVESGLDYLKSRYAGKHLAEWLGLDGRGGDKESRATDGTEKRGVGNIFQQYLDRALARKDSTCLDDTIRRTASVNGRELLAYAASRGRLSLQGVMHLAESYRSPHRRHLVMAQLAELDPSWTLRLARTLALQTWLPDDQENALSLAMAMFDIHGGKVFNKQMSAVFIDTAIRMRRASIARLFAANLALTATDRRRIRIDLLHPALGGRDESRWLEAFNREFERHGLEPLSLMDGPGVRFDRLCASVPPVDSSAAKVTVVVSAWKPGINLLTAVRSLLAQSWQNLEIIVVDDASPAGHEEVLEACQRLDPRVRVVRHEINQGTYAARNTAMQVASGDFMTFQDSDDFSHPRRIEWQVRPLLENDSLIATRSDSIRVDPEIVIANPGSMYIQGNASSLMFRLKDVMDRIGFFDRVRKGADSEYAYRIEAAFGAAVSNIAEKVPLAIVRLEPDSLSRSEFKPGWRHRARSSYREAYAYWHEKISSGEDSAYLPGFDVPRKFPAPRRFVIDKSALPRTYDVVFVGEWRDHGGPQASMIEEIRALRGMGLRLAIAHLEAFRFMTRERRPLSAQIRGLINEGVVDELIAGDEVEVRLAILRYPPILQFTPVHPMGWKVHRLMIVANQSPSELDGSDLRYQVGDCIRNARHLFGVDGIWAPQGPHVRDAIKTLVPPALLDPQDVPGILDVDEWAVRDRRLGPVPVIGRYSRDNAMKFPGSARALLAAYPEAEDIRVRIMGGTETCAALLHGRDVPANWELLPYGSMPVREFLAGIDFFVYYDNEHIVEAFGRSILEAMASGCVVILPHKFRNVFGEGALYAEPAEVEGMVRRIHADPAQYAELSARALEHVRRRFSYGAYADRIISLIEGVAG